MSQNWKRRRWGLFQPKCESLEERAVPAGGIVAFVTNGVLTIRGVNDEPSAFIISGAGERSVVIRPLIGTTINGGNDAIWVGDIKRGFDIQTGNGDDTVIISNVKARDFLSIVTNGGNDVVHVVHGTKSPHSTWIRTGDGDDLIFVDGTIHEKHFALDAGNGNDTVTITNSRFGKETFFQGGAGKDNLIQSGNDFRRLPAVANFNGDGTVTNPVALNDTATVSASGSVTINVLANDTPGQGVLVPSSVTITSAAANGLAQVNADGTIKYTNFNASATTDSFRYTVRNSLGGVSNEATVSISITADTAAPTATLSTTAGDPTNQSPMPFTVNFNQDVTGFALGDITVSNGTASNFVAVTAKQYTFSVTPAGEGTVTVSIPAGAAQNAQGKQSLASNIITRVFDTTAPTVTVNALTTNDTTPTITGTVNDGSSTVVVTVNGQTANGTITGSNWSATLTTPLADGKYTISVTATDKAGNVGSTSLANGLVIDTVAPTATISTTAPDPTDTSPIPFTVTFSEVVQGFALDGMTITGGTAENLNTTDNTTFTFNVTPAGPGQITVRVNADAARDAAGNPNPQSDTVTVGFEQTNPTVLLTTTATNPTRFTPIPVTATFSQVVGGFTAGDIEVINGTVENFSTVNGSTYTFNVVPAAQGAVSIRIPADVAQTEAGFGNIESDEIIRVFDSIAPTSTINALVTNNPTPTITGTVSEEGALVEVSANAIIVQAVVTGKTWSATFTQPFADGTYNVTAVAKDAAGNQSPNLLPGGLVIDTVAPVVFFSTTTTSPTNADVIPVTVSISEEVTGFTASSIVVTNGVVSDFVEIDAQSYTFNVTPNEDGQVRITLSDGAAFDAAGNVAVLDEALVVVSDRTAPTLAIISEANDPTDLDEIPFTITISEQTTVLNQASVIVVNGTIANFMQNDDLTYSFNVLPIADGLVTVSVPPGAITDAAGNTNQDTVEFNIVSARGIPGVEMSFTGTSPTNVASFPITATFTIDVEGFEISDIVVVNGTVENFVAVTAQTYTFDVVPTAEGAVTISIPADVATSVSQGKGNVAAPDLVIVYDITAPTGTISTEAGDPTNASPIPFNLIFSEAITGLDASMITVTNGTVENVATLDNIAFTFDVIPAGDGMVSVSIAAGVTTDLAGNGNAAVAEFTVVSDRTAPTPTIGTTAMSPTNATSLPFTITFDEDVTGFTEGDVTVTNGTIVNFTEVDAMTYTFDVEPLADGDVIVAVAAGVAQDAAGNLNQAATDVTVVVDITRPTATISTTVDSPTNAASFSVTIAFSEDVSTLVEGDILVVNGTLSNFLMVDAMTYTFDIAPDMDGDVIVSLPANVVTDAAGNLNEEAADLVVVSDRTEPTVMISTTAMSPTNATSLPFTVTFDEDVTGFTEAGVTVTNGTIVNFIAVDAMTYTFDVEPLADGDVIVAVAAGVAQDAAGNLNQAAMDVTVTVDITAPVTTISSTETSPTNAASFGVTIEFSEDVSTLLEGDIVVVNGTLSNFNTVDAKTYTFDIAPDLDGDVIVSLPAGVVTDINGNGNLAGELVVVSDRTNPTAMIESTVTSPTNAASIPVTVTFNEDVTGFDDNSIVVVNGTIVNFFAVSEQVYTFDVQPTADGDVIISIAAGVATDAAGNLNDAAADLVIVSDTTSPTTMIATAITSPTNLAAIPFTITFSEEVTEFGQADITVTNGTVVNFMQVDMFTYSFDVEPTADGDVTVSVAAGVATDAAGNLNEAAMDVTIVSDRTDPVPVVSTGESSPTNAASVPFTVIFDEEASGLTLAGIIVTNGTATNFLQVDAFTYTFDVEPTADGEVTVSIAANFATDAAGNGNVASNTVSFVSDTTSPTGSVDAASVGAITGTAADATSAIVSVQISIFNGAYWDGTGFNSAVEIFFDVTTLDDFATWSFAISETGTFDVVAIITDEAGNTEMITQSVTVS